MNAIAPQTARKFSSRWALALALILATPGVAVAQDDKARADDFLKGPEQTGEIMTFSGTVMGVRPQLDRRCHVIRVDRPGWPQGMGAGGRALLCTKTTVLEIGQSWEGSARQTGTGWVRMGPRWRIVPRFDIP